MHREKTLKCPYPDCDFMHATEYCIKAHVRKVHEKELIKVNTVYCDQCPFTAKYQSDLNGHIARVHDGDTTYWRRKRGRSGRPVKPVGEEDYDVAEAQGRDSPNS
jgi:hypothetical protein